MQHGRAKSLRRTALAGALLVLIVARTVTLAATQDCEPTLAKLRSGGRPLVVGGVSDFGPFNLVAKDGRLTGMDRDIIRAAGERLGIKKIEFKTTPFSRLGPSLLDGTIDLIANNYWTTPHRERLYAFTRAYYVRGGVGSLWLAETGPFDSAATIIPVDGTSTELDDTLRSKRC
jgi:ABC-type amino acid transport substrate-binding protein